MNLCRMLWHFQVQRFQMMGLLKHLTMTMKHWMPLIMGLWCVFDLILVLNLCPFSSPVSSSCYCLVWLTLWRKWCYAYSWIAWVHFSFTYYWVFKTWQLDAHAKSIDFYTLHWSCIIGCHFFFFLLKDFYCRVWFR